MTAVRLVPGPAYDQRWLPLPPSFRISGLEYGVAVASEVSASDGMQSSKHILPICAEDQTTCLFGECGEPLKDVSIGDVRAHFKQNHPELKNHTMSKCLWLGCKYDDTLQVDGIHKHVAQTHLKLNQQECGSCGKLCARTDSLKRHENETCRGPGYGGISVE